MPLNSCTIDSNTLNTFCSPRRGAIFNRLVQELHPVQPTVPIGGNPRVLRDTFRMPPPFEIDDREQLKYEQPFVTVTVEILGLTGTDTQDVRSANLDFVTVTEFELGSADETIHVNITNLDFR